ncbi:MAG: DUF2971 domain-containing protein [Pseudomonadota bacterium]|nr:DUF2971 domain-containing protein [Pseudomonadota bacterium]
MPRDPQTGKIRPMTPSEARDYHLYLTQYPGALGISLNKSQDDTIFHYSNVSGLKGICASKSLWSSDFRFMNDKSEINFGLRILEMIIAREPLGISGELRGEILKCIARMIEGRQSAYVFSTSFCKKGNLLSQWRTYGQRDGLAIEFRKENIENDAQAQNFITGKVHYYFSKNEDKQEGTLTQWIEHRVKTLQVAMEGIEKRIDEDFGADDTELKALVLNGERSTILDRWILETAAFIKHPVFEEECEWRAVRVVDTSDYRAVSIKDRSSGSTVIPYIELALNAHENSAIPVQRIIIGPNADYDAIDHSVSHILRMAKITNYAVFRPDIPLRV